MKGLLCWYLAKISNPLGGLTIWAAYFLLLEDDSIPPLYKAITIVISIALAYLAAKFVANNYEDYFINLYSWFSSRIDFLQTKTGYVAKTFITSFCHTAAVLGFIFGFAFDAFQK